MENLRLGVSAVRHDMKREETVEEVEKNTELERQTPKRNVVSSSLAGGAKMTAVSRFLMVYSGFCCCRRIPPAMPVVQKSSTYG